ncbi:hypothetical protein [Aeromonas sobria]|uniref:hypothetical protein n=1 Tax=Aeromonas sobria TaxID=646 RepID=UPI0026F1E479|nr:hypothetical protein [Aeromonas sobria]
MTQDLFELEAPVDELGNCEAGPAHLQAPTPVSQLVKHWQVAQEEFNTARMMPFSFSTIDELLALGAVRAVYWLALGSGEVALATTIGDWWAEIAHMHGLGETIK